MLGVHCGCTYRKLGIVASSWPTTLWKKLHALLGQRQQSTTVDASKLFLCSRAAAMHKADRRNYYGNNPSIVYYRAGLPFPSWVCGQVIMGSREQQSRYIPIDRSMRTYAVKLQASNACTLIDSDWKHACGRSIHRPWLCGGSWGDGWSMAMEIVDLTNKWCVLARSWMTIVPACFGRKWNDFGRKDINYIQPLHQQNIQRHRECI
jgi:hypothetical protein